jgi:parallel beta-helix repeat protein
MKMRHLTAALLVLALFGPALGDEGRIPLFQPTTITAPGHYLVVRDIVTVADYAVVIDATDVTLDLGGRTLSAAVAGVRIEDGVADVTVRNGYITGGNIGVYGASTTVPLRARLEDLGISDTSASGIFLNELEAAWVERCRVRGAGQSGIHLIAGSGTFTGHVIDNVIDDTGQNGIALFALRGGQVRGNSISRYGSDGGTAGLYLGDLGRPGEGGNRVEGNTIVAGGRGIDALWIGSSQDDTTVVGNVVARIDGAGIRVFGDGTLVEGNVVFHCTDTGIQVGASSRNLIRHNLVAEGAADGIILNAAHTLVDRNLSSGNAGVGLSTGPSGGHAYRDNLLRDNSMPVAGSGGTDAGGNIL